MVELLPLRRALVRSLAAVRGSGQRTIRMIPDGARPVGGRSLASQRWGAEGASRPRARADSTAPARLCAPSLAYRLRRWVLTVLGETDSSPAISGADRWVGR